MPNLTLFFVNPKLLDDVSFHPCVRLKKWEVCLYKYQKISLENIKISLE
jgi:hypothetical protein